MVQDVRRVILSEEELISALDAYRRLHPEFLPEGTIDRCQCLETNDVQVSILGASAQNAITKLSCGTLLAPIVRFCIESNIMLPRDGRKAVIIVNGNIALGITLDLNIDFSESVKPLHVAHIDNTARNAKG